MSELLIQIRAKFDLNFTELPVDLKKELIALCKQMEDRKSKSMKILVEELKK